MRQFCCDSLSEFLFGVLFPFVEGLGSIEDPQVLQSLLHDLSVLEGELQWVARQRQHLDGEELFQLRHGVLKVAQLVEGEVQTEQVGEVLHDTDQRWTSNLVVGDSQMDQRGDWLAHWLNLINHVACHVELLEVWWQVLNLLDSVTAEIEHLEVLKSHKTWVHVLNHILLCKECSKELVEVLFTADVLVQSQLLDDLAQFQSFLRPTKYKC